MDEADQQRSDRIMDFLSEKGLAGCPVCHKTHQFAVGPEHFIPATQYLDDPSEAALVIPVMCDNCGHMMLFGTQMLPNRGQ